MHASDVCSSVTVACSDGKERGTRCQSPKPKSVTEEEQGWLLYLFYAIQYDTELRSLQVYIVYIASV